MMERFFGNHNPYVIPEKPHFSADRQRNAVLSGIPFGSLSRKNQLGFRINFLSPDGEEKVLRNDELEHFSIKRDHNTSVMPAQAGIHLLETKMDSRQSLRDFGNDADSIRSVTALREEEAK
jgi:hypothetical protein